MRNVTMSILRLKLVLVCVIAVICLGRMPACAESNTGSSRMVEVAKGVSLRVIEAGKPGDQPALVFIPGWSTGADIWHRQINSFAETQRVIAFDPRSQGESTKTTSGNTPENRAGDLDVLLERLGVRRPVLIGWSQGVQDIAAIQDVRRLPSASAGIFGGNDASDHQQTRERRRNQPIRQHWDENNA
jgi:non-heme chloroperoxidase